MCRCWLGLVCVAFLATVLGITRFAGAEIRTYDLEIVVGTVFDLDFNEVVGSDLLAATGTGSLSYDDGNLVPGNEDFPPSTDPSLGLRIEFTMFGQTFTQADDAFSPYGVYPFLDLHRVETTPAALDFLISELGEDSDDYNQTEINDLRVSEIWFDAAAFPLTYLGNNTYQATVAVTENANPVPEPSTVAMWALCGLMGCGWWARRRRKAD